MIRFISTTTRPEVGQTVTGIQLKEASRTGLVLTGKQTTVRVNHVVDSKYAPNGYYVIGNVVKKK